MKLDAVSSVELLVALRGQGSSAELIVQQLGTNQTAQLQFAASYLPLLALDTIPPSGIMMPALSVGPSVMLNSTATPTVRVNITFRVRPPLNQVDVPLRGTAGGIMIMLACLGGNSTCQGDFVGLMIIW